MIFCDCQLVFSWILQDNIHLDQYPLNFVVILGIGVPLLPNLFLCLLHCPWCRVAILMFLSSVAMAIGILVYCLMRKKVVQGRTPFCVACKTCSGIQSVSACDTCPSSITHLPPFWSPSTPLPLHTSIHSSLIPHVLYLLLSLIILGTVLCNIIEARCYAVQCRRIDCEQLRKTDTADEDLHGQNVCNQLLIDTATYCSQLIRLHNLVCQCNRWRERLTSSVYMCMCVCVYVYVIVCVCLCSVCCGHH